ncbi:formylglycine-generating enzyme family protein [Neolewinella persica]|uniref:formylglycine-generating enzyme family protein n=1 Tax=Neolewinella persica TaxID=70998 RepID=UPI0009FD0E33
MLIAIYTAPVGRFQQGGYGLSDMTGNVNEWCWDLFEPYKPGRVISPKGASTGTGRLIRGGGRPNLPMYCRTTYRGIRSPNERSNDLGFRVDRNY